MSPALRRWLPREHGLWAWAGVALLLAPSAAPGAIPLLYPVRWVLGRTPSSPRECARVGMAELGWTALAAGIAALA